MHSVRRVDDIAVEKKDMELMLVLSKPWKSFLRFSRRTSAHEMAPAWCMKNSRGTNERKSVSGLKFALSWRSSLQLFSLGLVRGQRGWMEKEERVVVEKSMKMRMLPGRQITRLERVIYGAPTIVVDIQIFSRGILRYKNILCRRETRHVTDAPAYKHYAYWSVHVYTVGRVV